jgi:hypothetical protein
MHISIWFLLVIFVAYIVGARMPGLAQKIGAA